MRGFSYESTLVVGETQKASKNQHSIERACVETCMKPINSTAIVIFNIHVYITQQYSDITVIIDVYACVEYKIKVL